MTFLAQFRIYNPENGGLLSGQLPNGCADSNVPVLASNLTYPYRLGPTRLIVLTERKIGHFSTSGSQSPARARALRLSVYEQSSSALIRWQTGRVPDQTHMFNLLGAVER